MRSIYVASSWRNKYQQQVVETLRLADHRVYDFRNPPDKSVFHWSEIDQNWKSWSFNECKDALDTPLARKGFDADMDTLRLAEIVVLVLPCGRSSHLELGYAVGIGKQTAVFSVETYKPELMYRMVNLITDSLDELVEWITE